jgi:hypothetical protein
MLNFTLEQVMNTLEQVMNFTLEQVMNILEQVMKFQKGRRHNTTLSLTSARGVGGG